MVIDGSKFRNFDMRNAGTGWTFSMSWVLMGTGLAACNYGTGTRYRMNDDVTAPPPGGNQGNTGGDQGNTGGDQGNTGGNQGNTGGNQGNAGGNQGNAGGDNSETGGQTQPPITSGIDPTSGTHLSPSVLPPGEADSKEALTTIGGNAQLDYQYVLVGDEQHNNLFRVGQDGRLEFTGDGTAPLAGVITPHVNGRAAPGGFYTVRIRTTDENGAFIDEQTVNVADGSVYLALDAGGGNMIRYYSHYIDRHGDGLLDENEDSNINLGVLGTTREGLISSAGENWGFRLTETHIYSGSTLNPYRPEGEDAFTSDEFVEHFFRSSHNLFPDGGFGVLDIRPGSSENPLTITLLRQDGDHIEIIADDFPSDVTPDTNHFIYAVRDGQTWSIVRRTNDSLDLSMPTKDETADGPQYDEAIYLFAFWDNSNNNGIFQTDSVTQGNIDEGRPWAGIVPRTDVDFGAFNDNDEFEINADGELIYTGSHSGSFEEGETKSVEFLVGEHYRVGADEYIWRTTEENYYLHPHGPTQPNFNPDTGFHYFKTNFDLRPGHLTTTRYATPDNPLTVTLLRPDGTEIDVSGYAWGLPDTGREHDGTIIDALDSRKYDEFTEHNHFVYAARTEGANNNDWYFAYSNVSPRDIFSDGRNATTTTWINGHYIVNDTQHDELIYLFAYWDHPDSERFWIDSATSSPNRFVESNKDRGVFHDSPPEEIDGLYRMPEGSILYSAYPHPTGRTFTETYTINLGDVDEALALTMNHNAAMVSQSGIVILTETMISVSDPDNAERDFDTDADQITLGVVSITQGNIQRGGEDITEFSLADLRAGQISFIHDGTAVSADNPAKLKLSVTDSNGDRDSLNNRTLDITVLEPSQQSVPSAESSVLDGLDATVPAIDGAANDPDMV